MQRACRFLAREGVRQFVDIGSGLPTLENTHEIVHEIDPDAIVVYVDNDERVIDQARRLLCEHDSVKAIFGALESPDEILAGVEAAGVDLSKPVGLLLVSVLHFVVDDDAAKNVVQQLTRRLAPGSAVVISHGCLPQDDEHLQKLVRRYGSLVERLQMRTREQIESLFAGTELMTPPGLTFLPSWTLEGMDHDQESQSLLRSRPIQFEKDPEVTGMLAGLGRIIARRRR